MAQPAASDAGDATSVVAAGVRTTYATPLDIELIDANGGDMRRVAIDARADTALTGSIRRRGVLQPIGVRPSANGRYQVAFGRRRLRCAAAAGLARIPAMVGDWTDPELLAVQAVENMQRQAPHAIDTWCTVCDLVDAGYSIVEAADELGLDGRTTQKMERLGRLDPGLLKLAEIEMPNDAELRAIANATPKLQRVALKGIGSRVQYQYGDTPGVRWNEIAMRCKVARICAPVAIFDTAKHGSLWSEDMFAQPDDPDRFYTTDIPKFLKLQSAALEASAKEARANKKRVQVTIYDGARASITLPTGWKAISTLRRAGEQPYRTRKTECIFAAMRPDGTIVEVLAEDVAARKAVEKQRKQAAAKKQPEPTVKAEAETAGDAEAEGGSDDVAEVQPETSVGFTKAGLDLIARAKTEALHAALRAAAAPETSPYTEASAHTLLCLFVLALAADNIDVRPYGAQDRLRALATQLVGPGGTHLDPGHEAVRKLASDALAVMLTCGGPGSPYRTGSGDAAEWIGAAIDAASHLPRLDSAAILKETKGDTLRAAAMVAGKSATGSVTGLRAALAGNLPDWRPDVAAFGAAAPSAADEDMSL